MNIIDISKVSQSKEYFKKLEIQSSTALKTSKNAFNFKENLKFILFAVLLSTIILSLILFLQVDNMLTNENKNKKNISSFAVNTQINTLSQYLMESRQHHYSISDKKNESDSVFTKAIFDVLTLNESLDKNDLFSKKYTSVIIINSICFGFDDETNCEMKKYLDLTIKNTNKNHYSNEKEIIKDAVLPICIIEYSDENIILSVSCPETLSDNLKDDIISAFQSIKPNLPKEKIYKNELIYTNITENKNEIYINIFDDKCKNYKNDETKICETIQNLTLDKIGKLKTNKKSIRFETIKNNNNKYNSIYNYSFKDISNENGNNSNEVNFKYNLKILLDLIKPLLKKINHIDNSPSSKNVYRNLDINNQDNIDGVYEQNFFAQTIFGIDMVLNLKNDIGLGEREPSKIISNYIRGSKIDLLSHDVQNTNINDTLKQFINLSKAGYKLAKLLYENINQILKKLPKEINDKIKDLNNYLYFEDFSSSFDSVSSIDYLKILPYSIVEASQFLYSNLTNLEKNVTNSISDIINGLKENISFYIKKSHKLLDNMVLNILISDENKIIEISFYHLNENNMPYMYYLENIKKYSNLIIILKKI